MPGSNGQAIWLAAGLRTPFVAVDGPFAARDALSLSVPVVQAMAQQVNGPIDFGVWGSVVVNLAYANLAREIWLDSKLDPHVPTFTTIMQCSTSMVGAFEAAGMLGQRRAALAMVGGVESMSRVQIGLGHESFGLAAPHVSGAQRARRLRVLRRLRPSDIRLFVPEVKNRVTGRSMGEHTEDMAKDWNIGRLEQDELALEGHHRAVAAQDRGFFNDLIVPLDGVDRDHFPRRDTSMEKLARLKPVFDRTSGQGTLTAGNSSPLTDGAAAIWVATDEGLERLPATTPRVRLIDFEIAAVDIFHEGLLMAPVTAIPRLLARHGLPTTISRCGKSTRRFRRRCLSHQSTAGQGLRPRQGRRREHVRTFSARADEPERRQRRARPSVRGHRRAHHQPGGQGTRRLSAGSRAIVSICADGGLGTVALLER